MLKYWRTRQLKFIKYISFLKNQADSVRNSKFAVNDHLFITFFLTHLSDILLWQASWSLSFLHHYKSTKWSETSLLTSEPFYTFLSDVPDSHCELQAGLHASKPTRRTRYGVSRRPLLWFPSVKQWGSTEKTHNVSVRNATAGSNTD